MDDILLNYRENRSDIESVVTSLLLRFGVPANIKGYTYMRTGIINVVKDNTLLDSITQKLYPSIAAVHNTTVSSVERSIRHAINIIWTRASIDDIVAFFECDYYAHSERPSGSEFIALAADKIMILVRRGEIKL